HGRGDAIDAAEEMIAGYVAVTPLDDEEAGLLADLVAARLATDITLTTWRLGVYPDNAAYAADSEAGAPAFLDSIEDAGLDAVAGQQRLLATHSRYLHEAIVELAERLQATLPPALDAVIVVNSGSEANDLAWRIARAATGHAGALVTEFAYHGLTEATHALSPEEWAAGERPAHVGTVPAPDGYRGA